MPQATLILQQKLSYHPQKGKNSQKAHNREEISDLGVDTTNAHCLKVAARLKG